MKLVWFEGAWSDYQFWLQTDRAILDRINELVRDTTRSPFKGIEKPEPLRGSLQGWWSRRITGEHRLVYRVTGKGEDQRLEILQCRYHY